MRLQEQFEAAVRAQRSGDHAAAAMRYRALLEEALPPPAEHAIRVNLAKSLRRIGELPAAAEHAAVATELVPDDAEGWGELGLCLAAAGLPARAAEVQRRGLALEPSVAGWVNLGNALRGAGHLPSAVEAFEAALDLDPHSAAALFNLAATQLRDDAPEEAQELLAQCLDMDPEHHWGLFLDHALYRWLGGDEPEPPIPPFLRSSLHFALAARTPTTRLFPDTFTTLAWASDQLSLPGLVVELGVRHGTSLRYLAGALPQRRLVGFDSFEGLPVAWGDQAPGLYSTGGQLPAMPPHVQLVAGWFADTLPTFAASLGEPIALLHVDCDVYASAREALDILAPHLADGALIVFDDYLANPGWEGDEHRALTEVARAHGREPAYLAFSFFSRQAIVRW